MAERTRSLIHLPETVLKGQPFEVRVTLGHPMENGLRPDGFGNVVPRSLVTRFECKLGEALVCSVDLHPAIAANPYLSFWVRADVTATLAFEWLGDNSFAYRETRSIRPT